MSESTKLAKALMSIAPAAHQVLEGPRLNRVPWLVARYDMQHGYVLTINVLDDPGDLFSGRLDPARGEQQQWWAASQKVEKLEDVPAVVGQLYEQITAKLLGLAS